MGLVARGVVFAVGTISNAILFLFHSRVVLFVLSIAEDFPSGPADGAFAILPNAMLLVMGALQVGLILYFIGGLGQERAVDRRPMR